MSANTKPIFPAVQNVGQVRLTSATGVTITPVFTGGVNGSRVDDIIATSTSANDHDLKVYLSDGSDDYLLGTVSIAAGAGNSSSEATADILYYSNMSNVVENATGAIYVPNGYSIKVALIAALGAGEQIDITVMGGDY